MAISVESPRPSLRAPAATSAARPLLRASAAAVALTGLAAVAATGAAGSQARLPAAIPPASASSAAASAASAAHSFAPTQPAALAQGIAQFATFGQPAAPQPVAAPAPAFVGRVIMVIRHGEKPAKGHSLTARGWSRAHVLPALFTLPDGGAREDLPAPKMIYAASATDGGTGQRTRETVSSLSSRLNVPVNTAYGKGQESSLVRQALAASANGPVLICWQHGEIPAIARALKVVGPRPPSYWPGNRFDMVWKFTETPQGWTFAEVPEMLLPGDRS